MAYYLLNLHGIRPEQDEVCSAEQERYKCRAKRQKDQQIRHISLHGTQFSAEPTHSSRNPTTSGHPTRGYRSLALDAVTVDPALFFLPTFSPPQRRAMAELAALLTRLPDTVLNQFRDAARPRPFTFHSTPADVSQSFTANFRTKNAQLFFDTAWVDLDDLRAWLRQRGDLDHLRDPTISERNFSPVGLDPRSLYGIDGTFGDTTFDFYPVETPALESSSNPSFLPPDNLSFAALVSDPTGVNDALASSSDASFFPLNAAPSHALAPEPTAFPPPPQESFKFDDENPRLMMQEGMDAAGEAWQWVPSDAVWLDNDVSSDVYIPPQPFSVTKNLKVVRIASTVFLRSFLFRLPLLGRDSRRAGEKRHTSAIEKAKRATAGNNKIKELKAELAILVADIKTSSSGVVRVTQKSKAKSLGIATPKDATARPIRAPKKMAADEMDLDGIQMTSLEVQVEHDVKPDALEQENDIDVGGAPQSESAILANLDVDNDDAVISPGDSDIAVPSVNSSEDSFNSGVTTI
ncbi:hypothetical protein GGX14DRAFT_395817 [Mycena pura]|uniref:Uncharacterized protein n=1 Tax=Mycena pura TaxID=153505 RepID=A0AAD6VCM1_9AGAR|nr:hypothetical protein GGX14DRAFT_395817 [Mycena pura]